MYIKKTFMFPFKKNTNNNNPGESPKLTIHCSYNGCQIAVADTLAGQLSWTLGTKVNSH